MQNIPILISEPGAAPQITWAILLENSQGALFLGSTNPRCSMSAMLNQASKGAGVAMVGHFVSVAACTLPSSPRENVTAPAVVVRPRASVSVTAAASRRRSLFRNLATTPSDGCTAARPPTAPGTPPGASPLGRNSDRP